MEIDDAKFDLGVAQRNAKRELMKLRRWERQLRGFVREKKAVPCEDQGEAEEGLGCG